MLEFLYYQSEKISFFWPSYLYFGGINPVHVQEKGGDRQICSQPTSRAGIQDEEK